MHIYTLSLFGKIDWEFGVSIFFVYVLACDVFTLLFSRPTHSLATHESLYEPAFIAAACPHLLYPIDFCKHWFDLVVLYFALFSCVLLVDVLLLEFMT